MLNEKFRAIYHIGTLFAIAILSEGKLQFFQKCTKVYF